MAWKEGDNLPYDGWYNGSVKLMMANGTYADFRPKIEQMVEEGFYGKSGDENKRIEDSRAFLDRWDKEWEEIPMEERINRRNKVADDVTPRQVIIQTARGPMQVIRSTPSLNNNAYNPSGKKGKKKNPVILPSGFITRENSPLAETTTKVAAAPTPDLHGPVEAHLEMKKKPGRKPKESLIPQTA